MKAVHRNLIVFYVVAETWGVMAYEGGIVARTMLSVVPVGILLARRHSRT